MAAMAAESEEFERAWAQIVADLTRDDTAGAPQPAPDVDSLGSPASALEPADDEPSLAGETEQSPVSAPSANGTESAGQAARDPGAFVDGWSDEGHFTPPPPPDLPAGSPATRLGWAATIGGILALVVVALTGWDPPWLVQWSFGFAALTGFVTLVWQLPESREDGWDDGAQV